MATYEHTVTNCNPDIFSGLGVYSFAWRLGDGEITSVRAKLSSGNATFNLSKSANGISPADSDEGIGPPKWHIMADDLGAPMSKSDGDVIDSWYSHTKDRTGTLNRFTSASTSASPLYKTTTGPGSREGIDFDGSNDILTMSVGTPKIDYDDDFTVFAVLGDFTSGNQRPIIGNSDLTDSSWNSLWGEKGGDLRVRNDNGSEFNHGSNDLGADELRVLIADNQSSSSSRLSEYVDGASKYSGESISIASSGGGWSFNAIGGAQRDRNGSTQSRLYSGSLSELIMYEGGVLNTEQRQLIEGYLAHKWGITLNTGHPWLTTNPFATSLAATSDILLTSTYPATGTPLLSFEVSLGDTVSYYMPNCQNPGTLTVELTYTLD